MRTFDSWKLSLVIGLMMVFLQACTEDVTLLEETRYLPEQASQVSTKVLLEEELEVATLEVAGQALGVWRKYSQQKPTLLLLSNDPMLVAVPDEVWSETSRRIATVDETELFTIVAPENPAPLLLPVMTLDAALRSDWIGEVAWAVPLRDLTKPLDRADVANQLLDKRLVDKQEATSLDKAGEVIKGNVRGVPWTIGALSKLTDLKPPVIVHIDQSYFQQLYKNEVATPILTVVFQTLQTLREMNLNVLAVTFTHGNLSERISLDVRFLGEIFSEVFARPELLSEPLPKNWQRQSDIFYLQNFFQKEKVTELALAMEQDAPNTAWVKFSLYRVAATNRQGTEALDYLARAVALDNVYALEYLSLTKMAFEKGRPDQAMRMLSLAGKAFPDNPFIKLEMAQLGVQLGDRKTALHLVEQVQQLDWSPVYYPDMPQYLAKFRAFLNGEEADAPSPSINDPRRQRVLK